MSEIGPPPPPEPPVTPQDIAEIEKAILDGYRDPENLVRRIYHNWGVRLGEFVFLGAPGGKIVHELLQWADEQGRTRELLGLLWSGRPDNPELRTVGTRLLGSAEPYVSRYESALRSDAGPSGLVRRDNLEKIVTSRSQLLEFGGFTARLAQIARAICRVETPASAGTGFLIGSRTVVTNCHVVEGAIAARMPGHEIVFRFDPVGEAGSAGDNDLTVRGAPGDEWLLSHSRYSESDLSGQGDPAPDELDYAVIVLAEPVADGRIPLRLPERPPIVVPLDIAIVFQHPEQDPLHVAMGTVVELTASGLRYRYNATTKPGASGSPVFSASLELIGLHHAADPERKPRYNQAVPVSQIVTALARGKVKVT